MNSTVCDMEFLGGVFAFLSYFIGAFEKREYVTGVQCSVAEVLFAFFVFFFVVSVCVQPAQPCYSRFFSWRACGMVFVIYFQKAITLVEVNELCVWAGGGWAGTQEEAGYAGFASTFNNWRYLTQRHSTPEHITDTQPSETLTPFEEENSDHKLCKQKSWSNNEFLSLIYSLIPGMW